jgi:hypothetical protein
VRSRTSTAPTARRAALWVGRDSSALARWTRCAPGWRSGVSVDRFGYGLTDLLDDYTHAVDPGERTVIASALWLEAVRAAPAFAGRWISGGKWLPRELRELDPAFAARWLSARDDPAELAKQVLARVGGQPFDGCRAQVPD